MRTVFPIDVGVSLYDGGYYALFRESELLQLDGQGYPNCGTWGIDAYSKASITAKRLPDDSNPIVPDNGKFGYVNSHNSASTCWDRGAGCSDCHTEEWEVVGTYTENIGESWEPIDGNAYAAKQRFSERFISQMTWRAAYLGDICMYDPPELDPSWPGCLDFWEDSYNCPGIYKYPGSTYGMKIEDLDQASVAAIFGFAGIIWNTNGARYRYAGSNRYTGILYKQIPSFLGGDMYYDDIVVTHSDHPTWGKRIPDGTQYGLYVPFPPLNLAIPGYSLTEQTETKRVWKRSEKDKIVIELKNPVSSEGFIDRIKLGAPWAGAELIYADQGDFIVYAWPKGKTGRFFEGRHAIVDTNSFWYRDFTIYSALPFDFSPWGTLAGGAQLEEFNPTGQYTIIVWSPENGIEIKEVTLEVAASFPCTDPNNLPDFGGDPSINPDDYNTGSAIVVFATEDFGNKTFLLAIVGTTATAVAPYISFDMPKLDGTKNNIQSF